MLTIFPSVRIYIFVLFAKVKIISVQTIRDVLQIKNKLVPGEVNCNCDRTGEQGCLREKPPYDPVPKKIRSSSLRGYILWS